jgi:hypothetical protein
MILPFALIGIGCALIAFSIKKARGLTAAVMFFVGLGCIGTAFIM